MTAALIFAGGWIMGLLTGLAIAIARNRDAYLSGVARERKRQKARFLR